MSQTLSRSLAPLVVSVAPDRPPNPSACCIGDEIVRVNGDMPRDIIEWQMATDEADVELDVSRGGLELSMSIDKPEGAPLGIEVSSAVFDRVRTCDNHCEFCFIYQLPEGHAPHRCTSRTTTTGLSFLYGNFTTLTRFTEADLERVITERLVAAARQHPRHRPRRPQRDAAEPAGRDEPAVARALLDHDIVVKGQIVVCPGVNDGAILDDTMAGILDRFPELDSVAVVPLGISKFNGEAAMRFHTLDEAQAVVDIVADWQDIFQATLGKRMVYAADEYYLMAERPFPDAERYDGFHMHEDGIGMARTFEAEFHGRTDSITGVAARLLRSGRCPTEPGRLHRPPLLMFVGAWHRRTCGRPRRAASDGGPPPSACSPAPSAPR